MPAWCWRWPAAVSYTHLVTDVGVVLHGHYQSLLDHLGTGKDWDLSRKRGGLKILPPFAYKQKWGATAFQMCIRDRPGRRREASPGPRR